MALYDILDEYMHCRPRLLHTQCLFRTSVRRFEQSSVLRDSGTLPVWPDSVELTQVPLCTQLSSPTEGRRSAFRRSLHHGTGFTLTHDIELLERAACRSFFFADRPESTHSIDWLAPNERHV